jgi:hypothetical protein
MSKKKSNTPQAKTYRLAHAIAASLKGKGNAKG